MFDFVAKYAASSQLPPVKLRRRAGDALIALGDPRAQDLPWARAFADCEIELGRADLPPGIEIIELISGNCRSALQNLLCSPRRHALTVLEREWVKNRSIAEGAHDAWVRTHCCVRDPTGNPDAPRSGNPFGQARSSRDAANRNSWSRESERGVKAPTAGKHSAVRLHVSIHPKRLLNCPSRPVEVASPTPRQDHDLPRPTQRFPQGAANADASRPLAWRNAKHAFHHCGGRKVDRNAGTQECPIVRKHERPSQDRLYEILPAQ